MLFNLIGVRKLIFLSLYKSAILNSKWQPYMQRDKNGDNSILVGKGLKMQNSQQQKTVAKIFAGIHNAIHYRLAKQEK